MLTLLVVALVGAAQARASTTMQSLTSGGVSRGYLLHQPASLPAGKVPLMVALHAGLGSSDPESAPRGMESLTGFDAVADEKGFIVAYPASLSGGWHIGCCGESRPDRDDVDFIEAMVDELISTANVDSQRIYVTGFSVGAYMAYRMACESPMVAGMGSAGGSEILYPMRATAPGDDLRDPRDPGLLRWKLRRPDPDE